MSFMESCQGIKTVILGMTDCIAQILTSRVYFPLSAFENSLTLIHISWWTVMIMMISDKTLLV